MDTKRTNMDESTDETRSMKWFFVINGHLSLSFLPNDDSAPAYHATPGFFQFILTSPFAMPSFYTCV